MNTSCDRQDRRTPSRNLYNVLTPSSNFLAYYQGLTHVEIAAATGLALGTVKTRLRLGLSKLKVAYDRELFNSP